MKRFLAYSLVGLLAVSGAVEAQRRQAPKPAPKPAAKPAAKPLPKLTGQQVIDRYIAATGGQAAYDAIKSQTTNASFEVVGQGIRGTMEIHTKQPDKILVIQEIPGIGTFRQGFNGKIAWSQDPINGLRELSGAEVEAMKRQTASSSPEKLAELYEKIELVGREKVSGRDALVVRLTPKTGKPSRFYFDEQNFLLLRIDMTAESPQGDISLTTYLTAYKTFDGVKVPVALRQQTPVGQMTLTVTDVKNNVPLDDSIFEKPKPANAAPKPEDGVGEPDDDTLKPVEGEQPTVNTTPGQPEENPGDDDQLVPETK